MPNWTPEEYERYKAHAIGLRAVDPKPDQGHALECVEPGESKGGNGVAGRTRIRFTVFSVHPADWDGYHIKELQDMLLHAGLLSSDAWNVLQGEVVSEKVHTKAEERTEITIERL